MRSSGLLLSLPALLFLALFFALPTLLFLARSFGEPQWGFGNYATLLGNATYAKVLANTFLLAGIVTVLSIAIGYPVAWALTLMRQRTRKLVLAILLLSMWTNLLARTYAWLVLLQRSGVVNTLLMQLGVISEPLPLVNNLTGVVIGMTYIMLPFAVLPLQATLATIDPVLLQAGSVCGARPFTVFRRLLLPMSLPGIATAAVMIFVMSLGYYITPSLLGGTGTMMVAELIAEQIQSFLNWGLGSAAALVLLTAALLLYLGFAATVERRAVITE
ncbi:ABC transporter permease [Aliidongia dinghuensis]|uniref:ABC transporter permease n=1 Tax=Aliidongia dinghuensis TaxID=1867774 RepID=A0A8J2YY39_9PROT|nr:ABC transporter permease [Aliidongia dinghuensis]GGF34463.1 ABC transporter permease [Aliidongia dinghuensis]